MTPFVGMISVFAFPFAPKQWAFCNGQLMSIQQNAALFSLLGTTYGGNGVNNFALPDFRGRTSVHWGQSSTGTYYTLGEIAGTESTTLLISNMPVHTHTASVSLNASTVATGQNPDPNNNYFAPAETGIGNMYANTATAGAKLGNTAMMVNPNGGSQPMSIQNPYIVLNYCIALYGIFPSRN